MFMAHNLEHRYNRKYTKENIDQALRAINSNRISINKAAKEFNLSRTSLQYRLKGKRNGKVGRSTVFTAEEELELVNCVLVTSIWGFPLDYLDIRLLTKSFLDRNGRIETRFTNNLPGKDWVMNFVKRHKDLLSPRFCNNIKRARANVSSETLKQYFSELKDSLTGLNPNQIFNYDESNLSDDPGKSKMIFKRGVKYPDRVMNHSKSATTIMICVSAAGELLPPYVVYKATCLWSTWCEGGPKGPPICDNNCCARGVRYNRTNHGWFDGDTFIDWFNTCFLPHAKTIPGKKALIGDNLSSHFSIDIIKACEENDIKFICMPPNATHLCQPLDVAVFGPMKKKWRELLLRHKLQNRKTPLLRKECFPDLLSELIQDCASTISQNIQSGFRACGIYPLDVNHLLKRMPAQETEMINTSKVSEALLLFLQSQREGSTEDRKKRKRKLDVVPGKSISLTDLENMDPTAHSASLQRNKASVSKQRPDFCTKTNKVKNISSSKQNRKTDGQLLFGNSSSDEASLETEMNSISVIENVEQITSLQSLKAGEFILVKFQGGKRGKSTYKYVCIIQNVNENEVCALTMRCQDETKTSFIASNEIVDLDINDILYKLPSPELKLDGTRVKYVFCSSVSDVWEAT